MDKAGIGRRRLLGAGGLWLARPLLARAAAAKPRVAIETRFGVIVVEMETEKAPVTAANFLRYVDAGKYDGGDFFRASREPGAAGAGTIQGEPSPKARPFRPIAHENTKTTGLRHKAGAISMARNAPGTATSDFFICASAQPRQDAHPGAPGDNQGFAVFGQVVSGMNVVRKILAQPTPGVTSEPAMKGQMLDPKIPIISAKRVA